jgi:large subunit ribosomal protein L1
LGTVTPNVAAAVEAVKGGQVEYRVEKAGIIHAGVGKVSFDESAILENARTLIGAVMKAKPSATKGVYIKNISVSSTMGPGLRVAISSVTQ